MTRTIRAGLPERGIWGDDKDAHSNDRSSNVSWFAPGPARLCPGTGREEGATRGGRLRSCRATGGTRCPGQVPEAAKSRPSWNPELEDTDGMPGQLGEGRP